MKNILKIRFIILLGLAACLFFSCSDMVFNLNDIGHYKVTFQTKGGIDVPSQTLDYGQKAKEPSFPAKVDTKEAFYFFRGWCSDAECTKAFDFNSEITSDTTVYAKYDVIRFDVTYKFHETPEFSGTSVVFGDFPQAYGADLGAESISEYNPTKLYINKLNNMTIGANTYYAGSDGNWYFYEEYSEEYFLIEPIVWNVLTDNYNSTGKTLLLSEKILFADNYFDHADKARSGGIQASDYTNSRLRAYLLGLSYLTFERTTGAEIINNEFDNKGLLQSAFTESALSKIFDTTIDGNTDKLFVLSNLEADNFFADDDARVKFVTNYTYAGDEEEEQWWLRTPVSSGYVYSVDIYGAIADDASVRWSSVGIVPALVLK